MVGYIKAINSNVKWLKMHSSKSQDSGNPRKEVQRHEWRKIEIING